MKGSLINKILHKGLPETGASTVPCYAPSKSLRLGPDGRVTVCCHNNKNLLGTYPQQSLQQIWNAAPIMEMRTNFQEGKYADGCFYCIHEATQGPSAARSAALYDRYEALVDQPVILDFKTDTHCNLSCIMCSGLSSSALRALDTGKPNPYHSSAFVDEVRKWAPRLKEVRFSGGEPFLSEFYFQLWNMLIDVNPECKIVVQTNGTVLNDKIKSILERGNFNINVSVDSFDDNRYAMIRRGSHLSHVKTNLEWFRSYCITNHRFWGITSCAMQANCNEFEAIVNSWNAYEARGWFSVVWFPPSQALWNMPVEALEQIQKKFLEVDLPEQTETEIYNKQVFQSLEKSVDTMLQMAIAIRNPEPEDLCDQDAFCKTVLDFTASHETAENNTISAKIASAISLKGGTLFNRNIFLKITSSASPALLSDLFEIMDERELAVTLGAFIHQKPKDA